MTQFLPIDIAYHNHVLAEPGTVAYHHAIAGIVAHALLIDMCEGIFVFMVVIDYMHIRGCKNTITEHNLAIGKYGGMVARPTDVSSLPGRMTDGRG